MMETMISDQGHKIWAEVLAARAQRNPIIKPIFMAEIGGVRGIDVSSIQVISQADWQTIANSGIKFAIVKCGNGNSGIDSSYATHISRAQEVGIKVLAYHFI